MAYSKFKKKLVKMKKNKIKNKKIKYFSKI